jgi:formamidopyrimidine-DNA glycosylase
VPELPEVETTRLGLLPHIEQRVIKSVIIREARLRWPIAEELARSVRGQRIRAVKRRAKYLLLELDRGTLIWHLGMSGSLRVVPATLTPISHDHVDLVLDNDTCVRFNDPRRFGSLHLTEAEPETHPLLRRLAPEPLDASFDGAYLHRVTRKRQVAIKQLLMNSQVVVGVGNIYASEALFHSGIRPTRRAGTLSRERLDALSKAVKRVLGDAIRAGGTTLRDYVNPDGMPGYFRQKLYVYERAGEPCRVCKTAIKQLVQGQRSTYFCPKCQK